MQCGVAFAPLYAEQNPNIGTLLEHTGLRDGRVTVAPERFAYFVRKSGEPPRNRTGNLQIKSLVQSVVTDGHPSSLLPESVLRGHAYARCSQIGTQNGHIVPRRVFAYRL